MDNDEDEIEDDYGDILAIDDDDEVLNDILFYIMCAESWQRQGRDASIYSCIT
jgi:hypothetical protein